jgi:hypothetical protein
MSSIRRSLVSAAIVVLLLAASINACGTENSAFIDGPGDGGGGGTSGGFGANDSGTSGSDANLSKETACAEVSGAAQLQPLDIYFILDRSDSMGADCALGSDLHSKWCYASNALATYFRSSVAKGHRAALQYFTLESSSCITGSPHDVPAVNLTMLPALPNSPLITNIGSAGPVNGFGTQIEAAERGLVKFTADQRTPGRTMVGVLITDGDPNGCSNDFNVLSGILSDHLAATGIRTFIIGMTGATSTNLEKIAVGGDAPAHGPTYCDGVPSCHYYSVGDGEPTAFAAALGAIQQASLGCTLKMPIPDGGTIDPGRVKVEYLVGGNPPPRELTRVTNSAACVANGWYYDDNADPTTVNLCRELCETVQDDPQAKVDVLFGCVIGGTIPK